MKILVTGATGFVGNHIVTTLLAQGHDVIASSRSAAKAQLCAWYGQVHYLPLQIASGERDVYERCGQPDILIHTAWDKLDSYRDPAHFETTLFDHYFFIRHMVLAGLKQCVVTGTCLEYGLQGGALREEFQPKPVLAYPLAKHLLREMLGGLQLSQQFTLQWLRLFYLYGTGQRQNSLLAQLDAAITQGKPTFAMSKGDQVRDYLPVTEAAKLIVAVAMHPEFDGILNCCSGQPITVLQLVENYLRSHAATIKLNCSKYAYRDYEPFAFWGDRTRLDALLKRQQ